MRAHEKLLVAAVERQPIAVFIVRLDSATPLMPEIVYVNDAFCDLTGYDRGDIESGIYPHILGDETDRHVILEAARSVAAGKPVTAEVALYRCNGEMFWARVHSHPIDPEARYGVLSLEDITQHREYQKRLALLDEAVEQASDFVIVTDTRSHAEGGPRFVYVNRSLAEATGYERHELIGEPYTTIYSPNNDPAFMQSVRDAIEAGKPNYREMLALRKDRTEFWIEFIAKPFEADGEQYRLSIGRDITLRKRAFNQIALLFSALEQSPNRVVLYEPDAAGDMTLSYENDPAAAAGRYRFLTLWNAQSDQAELMRKQLLLGQNVQHVYAEEIDGAPALVELIARGVRNGSTLGAVLTTERVLVHATLHDDTLQSRLIAFAQLLPALSEAATTHDRLAVLRALLRDMFDAEVSDVGENVASDVHIVPGSRTAWFAFAGRSYIARWEQPMSQASTTALRFCIEAAIEQERVVARI